MLTKINGVLMSEAVDGSESGAGGTGDAGAGSDAGSQGTSDGGDAGGESGGDSGESAFGQSQADGQGDFGGDFDFDKFLAYDPFGEGSQTGITPGQEPKKEEGAQGQQDPIKEPAGQQKDPAKNTGQGDQGPMGKDTKQPGQEEKENPELVLLRNQVQALTQMLNQQQQHTQQATQGQGQNQGQKTPEQIQQERHQNIAKSLPAYAMNIPDSVMQKMGSDNPNDIRSGLAEFAQGVAQVTHYNVAMQMEERLAKLEQDMLEKSVQTFKQTTQAETAATEQKNAVFKDFYGKFPELKKPELQYLVQHTAKQLAQQYGVTGWNENFRDMLGEHVKKVLGMPAGQDPSSNAGGNQGNGQGQQQQKGGGQRFNAGSGAGRNNASKDDLSADIADTLFN